MSQLAQKHNDLVSILARLDLPKIATINGCPVFQISETWQKEVVSSEKSVATITTPEALEIAMQQDHLNAIYIPSNTFGMIMLERILSRQSLTKTIYWEA